MKENFPSPFIPKPFPRGDDDDDDGDKDKDKDKDKGGEEKKFTQADIDAQVKLSEKGLKDKNEELLGKLKEVSATAKEFEGLDAKEVRNLMDKLAQNEDLKLIAEGKHEEVIQKRMERERAKFNSDIDARKQEIVELKASHETANNQIKSLLIDGQAKDAFLKEGGREEALEDITFRARAYFTVEEGNLVARDADGELHRGKDGPITAAEWVSNLREGANHLFKDSKGSGGDGGGGGGNDDVSSLEAKALAAANSGDHAEYRRIRDEMDKAKLAARRA